MNQMELRLENLTIRAMSDGESLSVSGYVNKTNQLSRVLGHSKKFVERIAPGAFQRAIQNREHDIDFLAEHEASKILSSTRNDSLRLREDEVGLFMEASITPTSWGRDYYELITSGILRNMSFGFRVLKDEWRSLENGLYERTVLELDLAEVSVVKEPAYLQSTISARGIALVEEIEIPKEDRKEDKDLKLLEKRLSEIETSIRGLADTFGTLVNEIRSETDEVSKAAEPEKGLDDAEAAEVTEEETTEEPETKEDEEKEPEAEAATEEEVVEAEEEKTEDSETLEEVVVNVERSLDAFKERIQSLKQKPEETA
jgi:HK97 family phage prohead protease